MLRTRTLLKLDRNKDLGLDGIPPLILKSCASAFALLVYLLFNRSLATFIFLDGWKSSFVGAKTQQMTEALR
jgi:hypothetical protein